MAKYVFVNIPAYGHVNPTFPVVRELVRRGEEVVYYLTEEFRGAVEETGASFRPYQSFMGKPQQAPARPPEQQAAGAPAGVPGGAGKPSGFGGQAKPGGDGIAQMLERIKADRPDYIVYDAMHLWARTIAQALRVPAILTCPMFVTNDHFNPLKEHLNLLNGQVKVPLPVPPQVLQYIQAEISAVCTQYNLPPFDMRDFYGYVQPLNIVFFPRAFQPAGDTFDDRFVFVGPSLAEQQDASASSLKLPEDQSALYISLGTIFNDQADFFKLCFQAFGEQSSPAIVALGNRVDPATLGPVPANFQLAPYVQQSQVFPHTSVFITHAGMSSIMEGLYYGVPMVAIPQQNEQAATARRVAELGLGITLDPKEVTVERLREAVAQVQTDPSFRERASNMQKIVRASGGYQRAADAIQEFARKHALSASA